MRRPGHSTPRAVAALLIAFLSTPGCSTSEERREELTQRREFQDQQLNHATGTHARWDDDPAIDRLYQAMSETDRELAELEREEAERSSLAQLLGGMIAGVFEALAGLAE